MLDQIIPEVVKCLEFEVKGWPVKLKVDVEIGHTAKSNWGEMTKWEKYQKGDYDMPVVATETEEVETEEEQQEYSRSAFGY